MFEGCMFEGCKFEGCKFEGCKFEGCKLEGCKLEGIMNYCVIGVCEIYRGLKYGVFFVLIVSTFDRTGYGVFKFYTIFGNKLAWFILLPEEYKSSMDCT